MLIKNGANINMKSFEEVIPLRGAAAGGHKAVVQLLLDKGANIDTKIVDKSTPLGLVEAKVLADKLTPLHLAAWNGHLAVVELLLEKGADIKAKTKNGTTVLECAVLMGRKAVERRLLEHIEQTALLDSAATKEIMRQLLSAEQMLM
jgi:ankyrin repeat protein